jgi:Grx4 family monothiol glutaredoxin
MSLVDVTSTTESLPSGKKAVLLFYASWHDGCPPLDAILLTLASVAPDIFFGRINADDVTTWTDKYNITMVPTVLLISANGTIVERMDSGDSTEPSQITVAVQRLMNNAAAGETHSVAVTGTTSNATPVVDPHQALTQRLDRLIKSDQVMLFMKGKPSAPKCGFSRQVVELLEAEHIPFGSFDILTDETVRQGLKTHSNWPTYPQIYVNGDLVGGLDILKELKDEGSLAEQWNITKKLASSIGTGSTSLQDRIAQLTKRHTVMVFMKGLPSAPQCGFSRKIVQLLDESNVSYDAFNILEDEEVRQGLKEYSKWPTYPQLYVKGELVGGLDICEELAETGELQEMLKQ